jgi:hypothetical protein
MVAVVYIDDVGFNLHLTQCFGKTHQGQRCQWICPTQKSWNLSLVIIIGCKGVIVHNIMLGVHNVDKFLDFI